MSLTKLYYYISFGRRISPFIKIKEAGGKNNNLIY